MVMKVQEAVDVAVAATMEEMFFLQAESANYLWSKVRVIEPFKGSVTMIFPRTKLEAMAKSLFGEEGGMREQTLWDTLAEVVNTVAGRMMNDIVADDMTFKLSVPESGSGWPDMEGEPKPYATDEGGFFVILHGLEASG